MNDPYQSAVRAYLEGRYKEAECVCKELLKRHPKAHPALQLLALVEKRRGKHKLAVKNFRKAIQMAPEEAMYWNNLGETYREMGSIGEALDCYRKAVQYRGGYAEAHSNWGIALMAIGRHAEAEQQLTRAIQLNPQLSNAYFNLGVLHTDTGDMEQARQAYEHVLRLEPANTDALVNLAYVEKEHGRPDRALAHYLRAIEIDPSHFEAHLNLGNLYYHEGRYLEASQHSRKATELNPGSFDAWNGLGHTLNKQGHHKEAGNAFRQAHALDRRSPEALLGLAETRLHLHDRPGCLRALEQCEEVITGDDPRLHGQRAEFHLSGGDLAAAEAEARRCLTLDGNDVHAHQLIGQLKRFQDPDDPDLKRMRELFQRGVLSTSERYTLAFTIARALEQAGEYDTAFEYLQQANRLQRATFDYDIGSTRRYVDTLREFYTPERIGRGDPAANDDATPIFIVGMPRSGTSLVEQILASHPAVEGAGELDDFEWLYLRRCGVEQREMLPGHFDALTRDSYRRIAAGYLAALRERHPRARRVTDKMPTNFFHLAAIRMALPPAWSFTKPTGPS
jgi:tetratricopeptide (TPR) repeat protein